VGHDGQPVLAAIFDFDGTLIDTMPLHYEAYRLAFAECVGADLEPEVFWGEIGGTARAVVPRLLARVGHPDADAVLVHRRKKEILGDLVRTTDLVVLETAKLLPVLAPHLRLGLATSGSRPGIELMLGRLDWTRYFATVVTGEDVTEGKPAPEPFLLAAERLGVAPDRCVAFEDTDAGVRSARDAGMTVFDVRKTTAARA
jgi:beta-phosphoglucomutase-like phosphatase (HAD superfamily)